MKEKDASRAEPVAWRWISASGEWFYTETEPTELIASGEAQVEALSASPLSSEVVAALEAGVRAARLAIFVIRKQGVMPNSSWESGFNRDLEKAEAGLAAIRALAQPAVGRDGTTTSEQAGES